MSEFKVIWSEDNAISLVRETMPDFVCFLNEIKGSVDRLSSGLIESKIRNILGSSACERGQLEALAFYSLIIDLLHMGWEFKFESGVLYAKSIDSISKPAKELVRKQFLSQRDKQMESPSTTKFIQSMEKHKLYKGEHVSIFSLMFDGRDLYKSIEDGLSGNEQFLSPYIQIADSKTKCKETGYVLTDIWRYFRHTWANPYQSVPGRSMYLLVRDASRKYHPIIGISAISSAAVKVKNRDEYIGWEVEEVIGLLKRKGPKRTKKWISDTIKNSIGNIYNSDLPEIGLQFPKFTKFTSDEIDVLKSESKNQKNVHRNLGGAVKKSKPSQEEQESRDYWIQEALSPLFRSKRYAQLHDLYKLWNEYVERFKELDDNKLYEELESIKGKRFLSLVVRKSKSYTIGSEIADITVCGCVPPFNEILGGKLVAMLSASSEVVSLYKARYGNSVSIIASSMAGRPLIKDANLSFLSTTSLYGRRPNQYDRVSYKTLKGETVKYKFLGYSEGWGTVQFSDYTTKLLQETLKSHDKARVNYVFGEGANPKLRAMKDALIHLNLNHDVIMKHGLRKAIYGISLVDDVGSYLLRIDPEPTFLFDIENVEEESESIVKWWEERWLAKRINKLGMVDLKSRLESYTLTYPIAHGARVVRTDAEQMEMFS